MNLNFLVALPFLSLAAYLISQIYVKLAIAAARRPPRVRSIRVGFLYMVFIASIVGLCAFAVNLANTEAPDNERAIGILAVILGLGIFTFLKRPLLRAYGDIYFKKLAPEQLSKGRTGILIALVALILFLLVMTILIASSYIHALNSFEIKRCKKSEKTEVQNTD